jgi:hypothetical protein
MARIRWPNSQPSSCSRHSDERLSTSVCQRLLNQKSWILTLAGTFGLSPRPTNFTNFDNPQPSYLTSLKSKNLIPSLSYGYTAGAPYRQKKVQGSLTLGGYDSSQFVPNNVAFTLADVTYRDIGVSIESIHADVENGVKPLLTESILSFVDAATPQIWLPLQAGQAFEDTFGLTYDPSTELYLVNDTLHDTLTSQNPQFHFILSDNLLDWAID